MSDSQSPTPIFSVSNTQNSKAVTPSQSDSTSHIQTPDRTALDFELDDETILSELKSDQSIVDATERFLLNFKFQKRKPGRPKSGTTGETPKLPEHVNENFRSITDINDLHAGLLLDYIVKLNKFNKRLLNQFENLSTKYNTLLNKIESEPNSDTPSDTSTRHREL